MDRTASPYVLQDGATVVSSKAVALQHLTQQCEVLGVQQPALAQQVVTWGLQVVTLEGSVVEVKVIYQ